MGPQLYNLDLQARVQQAILGPGRMFYDGVLPFNNPAHFALVMAPLSLLPLGIGYCLWTALQMIPLALGLRWLHRMTSRWSRTERWLFFSALFAWFPLFLHFLYGSLSLFVILCLMGFYWALQRGADFGAGIWLALTAVKPQAALFPALVVLAGRRWRVLLGAGAAGLVIFGVTTAVLGPSIWPDYLRWLAATSRYFDRFGIYPQVMYNLRGTLTLLLGAERASLIQAVSVGALVVGMAGVLVLWARARWAPQEPRFDLRLAFTLTLGALLSPHQNPHDSLTLLLPVVLFYDFLRRTGRPTRAAAAFLLSWPVLFLLEEFVLRGGLGIRLPVVLMIVMLAWIGVRCRSERKPATSPEE